MKITKKQLKNELGNIRVIAYPDRSAITLWLGNIPVVSTSWHVDYSDTISLMDDAREDWLANVYGGDYLSDCAARRLVIDALDNVDTGVYSDYDPDDLTPQIEVKNKFVDFLQKKLAKI